MHERQRSAECDGHKGKTLIHGASVDGNYSEEEDAKDDGRDYEAGAGDEDAAKRHG